MRRAILLYNPNSGRNPTQRLALIHRLATTLRSRNLDVITLPTHGPNTAGQQASHLDTDALFACGGDGTVHEVLQGLAFHPHIVLGIIPLGSANVLARHLGLALNHIAAALQQLDWAPRQVPLGRVIFTTNTGESSRYFLALVGAGPDGALVYNMLAGGKHRLGRSVYYLRSAQLYLRGRFSPFPVTTPANTTRAVSAMIVRVADLGGLFSPLIPGASLHDPRLQLTTVDAPAHLSLPAWFAMSWARLHHHNPYVRTQHVETFTCGPGETYPVQVQADGEWLGRAPMTVSLVPNALRLLLPPNAATPD